MLGRQIELVIEDDQTTNPGAVMAFSKLAGDKDIPAFPGHCAQHADEGHLARRAQDRQTSDDRWHRSELTHMGNPWLFRFRPNDSYSARVIADYGVKTLGKKKWAIVHSTDAFGTAGKEVLWSRRSRTWASSRY